MVGRWGYNQYHLLKTKYSIEISIFSNWGCYIENRDIWNMDWISPLPPPATLFKVLWSWELIIIDSHWLQGNKMTKLTFSFLERVWKEVTNGSFFAEAVHNLFKTTLSPIFYKGDLLIIFTFCTSEVFKTVWVQLESVQNIWKLNLLLLKQQA